MVSPEHPNGERDGCRREYDVQREQEERVLVAERDRKPERRSGEEHDGGCPRVADEWNGAEANENDADGERGERPRLFDQELEVARTHERHGETDGGGSQEREPNDREDTAPRDERQDGAECADERSDLSGIRVLHDAERYVPWLLGDVVLRAAVRSRRRAAESARPRRGSDRATSRVVAPSARWPQEPARGRSRRPGRSLRSRLRAGRRCARARRPAHGRGPRRRRRPNGIAPGLVALRGRPRCTPRTGGRRSPRAERRRAAPARHENEAPEIPAQRSEPGQLLREAVLDEPRPCPPGLHQRAARCPPLAVGGTRRMHPERARRGMRRGGSSPVSCRRTANRASTGASRRRRTRVRAP